MAMLNAAEIGMYNLCALSMCEEERSLSVHSDDVQCGGKSAVLTLDVLVDKGARKF